MPSSNPSTDNTTSATPTPAEPPRKARKRRTLPPPPPAHALAFSVRDTSAMARIGRTTIYKLVKEGKLRLIRLNGRSLICGDSLRSLLAGGG